MFSYYRKLLFSYLTEPEQAEDCREELIKINNFLFE